MCRLVSGFTCPRELEEELRGEEVNTRIEVREPPEEALPEVQEEISRLFSPAAESSLIEDWGLFAEDPAVPPSGDPPSYCEAGRMLGEVQEEDFLEVDDFV